MPTFWTRWCNDYELIDDESYQYRNRQWRAEFCWLTFMAMFVIGLTVVTMWALLAGDIVKVSYLNLNEDPELLHTVSDKFLSFGIDSSLLRETRNFPLKDEQFIILAKLLSPAYVRIGGTAADCLYFNETMKHSEDISMFDFNPNNITNFTINGDDFISLNEFSSKAQLRMIFDLNVLRRTQNDTWDSTNAREIMSFASKNNFVLDWQLGNEPNSFRHVFGREVSAVQLAEDYKSLRKALDENGYKESLVFGPETNHIGDSRNSGTKYAAEFLANSGNSVDYLTWHQYYLNGREATVKDFINVTVFNYLPEEIRNFNTIFQKENKSLPTVLSETSTAYGGGAPNLSDRFVAGFLWLDKLGYSATAGVKAVIRQSFYGGHYAMVGQDLKPNPDWWISVIYKELVSEKVLNLNTDDLEKTARIYAHCTPKKSLLNRVPAATVFGINFHPKRDLNLAVGGKSSKRTKMFVYIFHADSLQSRDIRLNGKVLKLNPDGSLPPFDPMIFAVDEIVSLPPLSMFFIVVHGTEIAACTS